MYQAIRLSMDRYLKSTVIEFLKKKMVFLGGPRQVGKTTLSLSLLKPPDNSNPAYLNWDDIKSRAQIRQGIMPAAKLVVLDEIHKYRGWRNLIKGLYDKNKPHQNYLVTGSAKLDHYRRGGDSLMGRYRYLRLHPISYREMGGVNRADVQQLLKFGGFPEPFFSQNETDLKLWWRERLYRLVNEDLSALESLSDLGQVEALAETLVNRVGGLLSLKSLEEDLSVSSKTIGRWVEVLENLYYCYRIYPFQNSKLNAIKKMPKIYLWDWSPVEEIGPRFENLVANQLLKQLHFLQDTQGEKANLYYLRDTHQREVDFAFVVNKRVEMIIECKSGKSPVSKSLLYFASKFPTAKAYQVHLSDEDYLSDGVRVLPFHQWAHELQLV